MSKIKIAIDAGHGSETAGKRTVKLTKDIGEFKKGTQVHEHWIDTYVCKRLYDNLVTLGYDVLKSGWDDGNAKDDADVALSTRNSKIKSEKCDYVVSIHLNAYGNGKTWNSANGIEVLVHSDTSKVGDSKKMADYVLKELLKGTNQKNRGVKSQRLDLCNCKKTGVKAAILCELAFMTNLYEVNTMVTQEDFWEECAEEIAIGIDRYVKAKAAADTVKKTGYIKVLATTLNIRSKPSWAQEDVCGTVKKGNVYTVAKKVEGGFYLLKSGVYITSSKKYVSYYEK